MGCIYFETPCTLQRTKKGYLQQPVTAIEGQTEKQQKLENKNGKKNN